MEWVVFWKAFVYNVENVFSHVRFTRGVVPGDVSCSIFSAGVRSCARIVFQFVSVTAFVESILVTRGSLLEYVLVCKNACQSFVDVFWDVF